MPRETEILGTRLALSSSSLGLFLVGIMKGEDLYHLPRDFRMDEEGQGVVDVTQGSGQPVRCSAAVQAQTVPIFGGAFSSAGRNVNHHHTHFHEAPKPERPKIDLLSELKVIDNFRRIQQDTLSKATPETGEWIFEYEIFPVWRGPKSDLKNLWGSGIRESIVVAGVSKWAKHQTLSVCIGYIYIRYSDNAGLTVRHCLEVLVKQTIEQHPKCLKLTKNVCAEHIHLGTRPTEEELLDLLRSFTTVLNLIIYFLDALDEAPPEIQFDLVDKLLSLDVKHFITSRPMKPLQIHFPDAHCFPIAADGHDIDLHITKEIN
ncbi:hypothetical protein BKA70DRAFT_1488906 [Coprinopsis sp. MPI-PUGE-AT-0042]|nr:hypothetical protein BKA70DRAFT_1488906 [Coprinopsis sp. MPI-PUGE-AT-0042]